MKASGNMPYEDGYRISTLLKWLDLSAIYTYDNWKVKGLFMGAKIEFILAPGYIT